MGVMELGVFLHNCRRDILIVWPHWVITPSSKDEWVFQFPTLMIDESESNQCWCLRACDTSYSQWQAPRFYYQSDSSASMDRVTKAYMNLTLTITT